jgi:hypothetical protein
MITNSKMFADEEKESVFTYPKDYRIRGMLEQVDILSEVFAKPFELRDEQWQLLQQSLPPNSEGWFVIPRWQKLFSTYNEAVIKVLELLASNRRFQNLYAGNFGTKCLRRCPKTAKMMQRLADSQDPPFGGDLVVVPCQFGLRHRGRSVRRARAVFLENEFGLGIFEMASMLFTHPERETRWKQLHVDCAGDEISPNGDGKFCDAPVFSCSYDNLEFDADWVGRALEHYSSPTGFVS